MCGIGGILRVHPPGTQPPPPEVAIPEAWLDLIDESIKHRGPDGKGRFRDRALRSDGSTVDVTFVHRRLSIIDHAGGHQPMVQGGTALLSGDEGDYRLIPCHNCPKCQELAPGTGARTQSVSDGLRRPNDNSARPGPASTPPDNAAPLLAVVFNGCIYNHRELRKELQAAGHVFATDHSDTEVLVHGWREWEFSLSPKLEGMFALAIWDSHLASLITTRDRAGEKPLYMVDREGPPYTFAISSTAAGLLRLPLGKDPRIERSLVKLNRAVHLRQWVRHGFAVYPAPVPIGVVRPGMVEGSGSAGASLTGRVKRWANNQAWNFRWAPASSPRTWHPPEDRFDDLLSQAVRARLDADVPVGCFLSGGVDSSLITCYAAHHRPDIEAFTIRMPDDRYDESAKARAVAQILKVKHHVLDCDPHPADDLVRLIQQLGLPFGDSSLLPTYWVCKAASRHIRVALSGDGADELFAGYQRYNAAHLLGLLGPFRLLLWPGVPLAREDQDPRSATTRIARFVNAAVHDRYVDLVSIFPEPTISHLGLPDPLPLWGRTLVGAVSFLLDTPLMLLEPFTRSRIAIAIEADLGSYLPEDILRKTDTASMAIPLEVRAPFLDSRVYDAASQSRISHLMPHHQRKGLLRAVARKYFPKEIVDRPKQGFAIPIGEWFRSDYGGLKTLLLDHLNSTEPWGSPSLGIDLNMKFVRQMLDEHLGTGPSGLVKRDHSQRLYMLLVLSIWAKWLSGL